ncbi:GNAT family N-acetyltransferase [Streptomyces sp. NBC_00637]|uniref:GNAT family N-acetyltransferase n=1 Tax=Streptomyces sp. NBC_00637 TaxID=2903667 RepID=UPI0032514EF1
MNGGQAPTSGRTTDTRDLLAAYDAQLRGAPPRAVTHAPDGPLTRIAGPLRALVTAPRDVGLRGGELDELIARQRDFFAARGEAVEWRLRRHDLPADLPDRLRASGFTPDPPTEVLIGSVEEAALRRPVLPGGVTLRQVGTDADLHAVAALQSAVWGLDLSGLGDDLIARIGAAPRDTVVLAAEAGGQMVSAAWLAFRPGTQFATLLGGSTLAEWRGKGIYRALVDARVALAADRGTPYLHVDASPDSAPVLRRLGFRTITTMTPYVWTP